MTETAKIKAPILAINGKSDTTVTPDNAEKIIAAAKNGASELLLLDHCDHTYNVFSGDLSALSTTIGAGIDFFQEHLAGITANAAA